jgi:hypothetical protein
MSAPIVILEDVHENITYKRDQGIGLSTELKIGSAVARISDF